MTQTLSPRLITRIEAANYCGVSPSAFSNWVKNGKIPQPVFGTNRWDKRAIDVRLDKLAGITPEASDPENDFDEMEAKIDARIAERSGKSKKASR